MSAELLHRVPTALARPLCLAAVAAACGASDSGVGVPPPNPPGGGPPLPAVADTAVITVDNTTSFQSVDGFGGTTLTLVYGSRDYLGPLRPAAIKAAYSDIGITLGTLNIGIQETPANASDRFNQRGNDNGDPFVINPSGFNFTDSDILRDKIVVPAMAYGFRDFALGQFIDLRGPVSWLQSTRSVSYSQYLDESAEYVLAILQHWRDSYGLTPRLLHLVNEPTSGNTELRTSSTQEVVDLVKRIGGRLRAAGFANVKFIVPNEETVGRTIAVAQAILADPAARPYVGVIGYHPYPYGAVYTSPRTILTASGSGTPDRAARQELEQLRALSRQYGVPVWLTEVTQGPGNNDYGFDAVENVLARAIHIHDNFEFAEASAYFGMVTIWDSQSHAEHFAGRNVPFLSAQSGMVLVDLVTGRILITGMGYAVGHYARWIKPGAQRIGATSNRPRVIVSAFRDASRRSIVLVAVNNEPKSQLLRVRLNGAQASGQATGEASYGQVRWESLANIAVSATGVIDLVAQPSSVVTIAVPY